jgi:predicted helicase
MTEINRYFERVQSALKAGNATEHTHRPFLKDLIESISKGITATNEPKREKVGAPDYIVTKGEIPLGYVEAKDVGRDLDKLNKIEQEQLKRYRESLNNLILTNYLEFRWYVKGELRKDLTVKIAEVDKNGNITPNENAEQELITFFTNFFNTQVDTVTTPKDLAARMAAIARLIRRTIEKALANDSPREPSALRDQMKSFREVLLPTLKEEDFADLYAQTIAYGLFTARCYTKNPPFTRQSAAHYVPKTNPFLRELFNNIAGINLDERIVWLVDDLAELLNRSDISGILQDFGKRTRQEDPVVHFYETFLTAYDPKLRETRGVYYTPEPVVSYIVRSVDRILKEDFGMPKGLADSSKLENGSHKLLILDPATGTGTFLYSVIKHIAAVYEKNKGMWSGYVAEHLLPRIFGFELLVAPYAVAHLKLGLLLEESGYQFDKNERLRVYLTNTLEELAALTKAAGLTRWLGEEAEEAASVKREKPVMLILGNPPYSGHSANTGKWINRLLRGEDTHSDEKTGNYFEVDGKPLGEKNPKWLNDDYVKFIRFSQRRIEQTGYGVLAFITNHGYLDNPTFRGMRQSLMQTFDEIYVLDLHGNAKKKERSPDGSKDENVFDIQQGVSIGIFIKKQPSENAVSRAGIKSTRPEGHSISRVFHSHLYGVREIHTKNEGVYFLEEVNRELIGGKYKWLSENDLRSTEWTEVKPSTPFYLFTPQNNEVREEYEQSWRITDVMPINVLGFQTHRDHFAIDFDREELLKRIYDLYETKLSDNEIETLHQIKSSNEWKLEKVRRAIRNNGNWKGDILAVSYRPFDNRFCYYSGAVVDRPRRELLDHVVGKENLCLGLGRQGIAVNEDFWGLISASRFPVDANVFRRGGINLFPLYLYHTEKKSLFDEENSGERKPNLAPEFIAEFENKIGLKFQVLDSKSDNQDKTFTPEDVFYYAYAVFHSTTYRSRYAEFLKIDFPRLPLTSNVGLFRALTALGGELVGLHLLERDAPELVGFPVGGDNAVEFVKYEAGKVHINKTQYFDGVPQEVWEFHIGGYRVAEKWLKDRKGRTLTFDDLEHYQKTIAALARTIELMSAVDETIETHGGFPIN